MAADTLKCLEAFIRLGMAFEKCKAALDPCNLSTMEELKLNFQTK